MQNCGNIGVVDVEALPIDNLESTPDYLLAIREIVAQDGSGNVEQVFTRVPTARLVPSGNLDNVFALDTNNPELTVEEGQPLPAYVSNEVNRLVVLPANAQHKAQFLVTRIEGDMAICQNCGVIYTLGGNRYNSGSTYYLAADGGVTTDPSQTGQKLFVCLGKTKLGVTIGA